MEAVTIIAPRNYEGIFASRLRAFERVEINPLGGVVVHDDASSVHLYPNKVALDERDPAHVRLVFAKFSNPHFYLLDFSNIELAKAALVVIADDPELWVDNDHGLAAWGPEFIRMMRAKPGWDWRRDDAPSGAGGL